jgi:hypothetical protein
MDAIHIHASPPCRPFSSANATENDSTENSIEHLIVQPSETNIDNLAFAFRNFKSIQIPNSVSSIGEWAFIICQSLISVNIPNSMLKIANHAFMYCPSLTLIAIPQSVILVGHQAFDDCASLQQRQTNGCNYHADTQTWLRQRFDNLPLHQAIYNSLNTMTTTLLSNTIQQHSSSTMLTSTDAMLMNPLHVLCCSPTVTAEMIRMLKAACPDAASMRNVLNETPLMMYLNMKCKKKECNAYHENGQLFLPLVKLLDLGIECELLEIICIFYDEVLIASELEQSDEVSGLLPFMYGASLTNCGLNVVYELAMRRQDLLLNF